jgi:hypothetical protein
VHVVAGAVGASAFLLIFKAVEAWRGSKQIG